MARALVLLAATLLFGSDLSAFAPQPVRGQDAEPADEELRRLRYRNPDLVVDLAGGLWAWPLPMDYDRDGDHDLVVSSHDVPYGGTYFFENPAGSIDTSGGAGDVDRAAPSDAFPVFRPARRIAEGGSNVMVSYRNGTPRVLAPGVRYREFHSRGFADPESLLVDPSIHDGDVRAHQWREVDYEGDGDADLIVGVGDWAEYGWDDAYDAEGNWTRGPLHGYVYLVENRGTDERPAYASPRKLRAEGAPVDVYGRPSPNLADFDGDGDLDLICGEFLDRFTYFENVGTRSEPTYAEGRVLTHRGAPIEMDLQMIVPTAIDWDRDGDPDLVVGDEDGRVAWVENTSGRTPSGLPAFSPPRYFRQQARFVKFGALVTPVSVDWDGDGDEDLVAGNSAGYVGFIENLDGGDPPRWAPPRRLEAGGLTLRIQAGPNGSIQGPAEAEWGYTTISVADWDGDGLPDLVLNSIWGRIDWCENVGTRTEPRLARPRPVRVIWPSDPPKPAWNWWDPGPTDLVTQWRTRPVVADWNEDGLSDLVMLDTEGYLAFYERAGSSASKGSGGLALRPPRRVFVGEHGAPIRLNDQRAGGSGRRKIDLVDWDGDGDLDLLVDGANARLYRTIERTGDRAVLRDEGPLAEQVLAGHTTSPTTVDWDGDGTPSLLLGAEDGHLYYLPRP